MVGWLGPRDRCVRCKAGRRVNACPIGRHCSHATNNVPGLRTNCINIAIRKMEGVTMKSHRMIWLLTMFLVLGFLIGGCNGEEPTATPVLATLTPSPIPVEVLVPDPLILEPTDGDLITGETLLLATDRNGVTNSVWARFEYSPDTETWYPFPEEADLSLMGPSWRGRLDASELDRGQCYIRVVMRNANGEENVSPYITVFVNHAPTPRVLAHLEGDQLILDARLSTDDSSVRDYLWFWPVFPDPHVFPVFDLYVSDLPAMNEEAFRILEERLTLDEWEIWDAIPAYIEEYDLDYEEYDEFLPDGDELDALELEIRDLTDDEYWLLNEVREDMQAPGIQMALVVIDDDGYPAFHVFNFIDIIDAMKGQRISAVRVLKTLVCVPLSVSLNWRGNAAIAFPPMYGFPAPAPAAQLGLDDSVVPAAPPPAGGAFFDMNYKEEIVVRVWGNPTMCSYGQLAKGSFNIGPGPLGFKTAGGVACPKAGANWCDDNYHGPSRIFAFFPNA